MVEKFRGIILRKLAYSEADLIVHFLCPQNGRLAGLARGALKSKKRFVGGILEPTHFVEVVLRQNRHIEGLRHIEEAKLIEDFSGLRQDYSRLETGLYFVDVVDQVLQFQDPSSMDLFNLLGHALRLAATEGTPLERLRIQFNLKFLYQQGILDPADWMAPFLRAPLTEVGQLAATGVRPEYSTLVETQVRMYLRNAESRQ